MKTIRLFCLFCASLASERVSEEINQSRRKDGSRSILYGETARSAMNLARAAETAWNDRGKPWRTLREARTRALP